MKIKSFLLAICLMASTGLFAQTYVHEGEDLQAAVNAAEPGTTVYVQAGTFYGNFQMKEGVNVSGGWNADFTAQTDYATILDAQENGRVLNQPAAFSTLTVWSNLTIQNGKLAAALSGNLGAGVALNLKGQVKHCLIQNNTYSYSGNCIGGGVGEDATPSSNTEVMVDDCWIRNNKASHGGGIRIRGTIQNSIIENNQTSGNSGGGAHLQAGRMVSCIVRGNISSNDCGGVRLYGKCDLINCLIYNNTATGSVGGVGIESALSNVIGNTIVKNNQVGGTGSIAGVKVAKTLNPNNTFFVNNVVWGNMSNGTVENQQVYYISRYDKSQGQRSYNAIMGQKGDDSAETSIQLTAEDPGFVDAANGDFSLLSTSVLLDRGNSAKATVTKDLVGNDRIVNSSVDIGAYEYPVVASDVYVLAGEDLQAKIDNTAKGFTVYVQAGTFYGNFTMKDGVNVSGGWDANFETKTDYATILDAQENGRVLNQPANFTTLTIWSNLTIQNGKLTANMDNYGAGVFLRKNGQVKHCVIQDNTFTYSGTCMGGGVANNEVNEHSDVLIDDCIIRQNLATHGGGVRIVGTIQNSIIEQNATTNNAGGGVHLFNGGRMYNCIIRNNTAGTTANASTGGVRMSGSPAGVLANCLIASNHATNTIGGLALESSTHQIFNNTIVNNTQAASTNPNWCGVRVNVGGPLQFCNNIVWGNKVGNEVQSSQIHLLTTYANQANNFAHNAVVWSGYLAEDGSTRFNNEEYPLGVNTILLDKDTDPGFTDAAHGDYTLAYPSELIDSGHGGYFYGEKDLAGNTRKVGTIDRGCYEYTYENPVPQTYQRAVAADRFGTICLPYAVAAGDITGAQVYKVLSFADANQAGLLLEEVDAMEAGKPYFFLASAANVSFDYMVQGLPTAAGHENGLYGAIAAGVQVEGNDYYVLQNNLLHPATAGAVTLASNRAYIKFSEIPAYTPSAQSARRRVLSIHNAENSATDIETITGNPSSVTEKVLRNGQLFIIRDGKTYNAQGRQIK